MKKIILPAILIFAGSSYGKTVISPDVFFQEWEVRHSPLILEKYRELYSQNFENHPTFIDFAAVLGLGDVEIPVLYNGEVENRGVTGYFFSKGLSVQTSKSLRNAVSYQMYLFALSSSKPEESGRSSSSNSSEFGASVFDFSLATTQDLFFLGGFFENSRLTVGYRFTSMPGYHSGIDNDGNFITAFDFDESSSSSESQAILNLDWGGFSVGTLRNNSLSVDRVSYTIDAGLPTFSFGYTYIDRSRIYGSQKQSNGPVVDASYYSSLFDAGMYFNINDFDSISINSAYDFRDNFLSSSEIIWHRGDEIDSMEIGLSYTNINDKNRGYGFSRVASDFGGFITLQKVITRSRNLSGVARVSYSYNTDNQGMYLPDSHMFGLAFTFEYR